MYNPTKYIPISGPENEPKRTNLVSTVFIFIPKKSIGVFELSKKKVFGREVKTGLTGLHTCSDRVCGLGKQDDQPTESCVRVCSAENKATEKASSGGNRKMV